MRLRNFVTVGGAMAIVLGAGMSLALAADWLGQCAPYEPGPPVSPESVPTQMCLGLTDCGPDAASCSLLATPGTCRDNDDIDTQYEESRTIQWGDCTNASNDDECYECQQSDQMICCVRYEYQDEMAGECKNRCPIPEQTWTAGYGGKCKP